MEEVTPGTVAGLIVAVLILMFLGGLLWELFSRIRR